MNLYSGILFIGKNVKNFNLIFLIKLIHDFRDSILEDRFSDFYNQYKNIV